MSLHAVILGGGSGTRFWPLSRRSRPKQFLRLATDRSLIADTFARLVTRIPPERIHVVATAAQTGDVARALPTLPKANLMVEPEARNTAPALGLAAALLLRADPDAVMAVFPADHSVGKPEHLLDLVDEAARLATEQPVLVTFGIVPDRPATGFGYIEQGAGEPETPAFRVERFVEKPDAEKAHEYLAQGNYLWNSGMFVWAARTLMGELATHEPALGAALQSVVDASDETLQKAVEDAYAVAPRKSIDVAVLERSDAIRVIPADIDWNDLGTWAAVDRRSCAQLVEVDSEGNVVHAPEKLVALLGVKDLVVVDTEDVLLVCPKTDAQRVKELVGAVQARGLDEYL